MKETVPKDYTLYDSDTNQGSRPSESIDIDTRCNKKFRQTFTETHAVVKDSAKTSNKFAYSLPEVGQTVPYMG